MTTIINNLNIAPPRSGQDSLPVVGTMASLIDAIQESTDNTAVYCIEEFPVMPFKINRGFWGRIWAAVWDKPTFDMKAAPSTVTVTIIGNTKYEAALRQAIEFIRPAGVEVIINFKERIQDYG